MGNSRVRKVVTAVLSALLVIAPALPGFAFERNTDFAAKAYLKIPLGPTTRSESGPVFGFTIDRLQRQSFDDFDSGAKITMPALVDMSFDSLGFRTLSYNGINVERPIVTLGLTPEQKEVIVILGTVFVLAGLTATAIVLGGSISGESDN